MTRLSPRSQAIRILIGDEIPNDYSQSEIAKELGVPSSWVAERLNELRNELLLQTNRFFPLTDHEYASLRASIELHGVQTPVILGEHIPLIDGRHRWLISQELGLVDVPAVFLRGMDAERERELSISLNVNRRQLNQAQKRTLIQAELMRDAARTDRHIAIICGVDHVTVGGVRREMADQERLKLAPNGVVKLTAEPEANGKTPQDAVVVTRTRFEPEVRIDHRGGVQRAPEPRARFRQESAASFEENSDAALGHALCCHGQRHAILRDGAGYRLEAR